MSEKIVLDGDAVGRALTRVAHEIAERESEHGPIVIVGIQSRGVPLARRLAPIVEQLIGAPIELGELDIAFYRDDVGSRPSTPIVRETRIDANLTGKTVIVVDDVLFTGRTVRAAIDALFDFGRPRSVRLAVLVDRGHRELPIRPDFVGKNLPTSREERVNVRVAELDGRDEVAISEPASEAVTA